MKEIIALICFMIGMFAMLPSTSSGSGSPPNQVCMVADVGHADFVAIDRITTPQYVTFEFAAVKPPGLVTAENVVQKSPDFRKFYRLNYRTCYTDLCVRNQDKLLIKDKVSPGQIRIRDDTSLG